MTGPLDPRKSVSPSDGQGEPTVFPGSAFPIPPSSVPRNRTYPQQPSTPAQSDDRPLILLPDVKEQYANLTDGSLSRQDLISVCIILLNVLFSILPSEVDVRNEGACSSRLGIDFQAVSDEQTDILWSQQPTLQHQHEDQLSEQERGLLQLSVGISKPLSQRPLDLPAGTSGDANNALSALTPQIYEGQLSEREHRPLLQESIGVSDPLSQHHLDLPTSTSGDTNYALGALTPQNYTSYQKQNLCQQPCPGVVPGQKKVQCTRAGCSTVVRRDGLTRHMNETHLRVVKATCTRCGKGFQRLYLKRNHEVTCRG